MTAIATELKKKDFARSFIDPESRIQQAAEIHQVALSLAMEFALVLPLDIVSSVVTRAFRDLSGEVPAESLPEFVHQAARQRLIDAGGFDPLCGSATRRDLLAAATDAHAPTSVIEDLLRLPEQRYPSPAGSSALLG